MVERRGGMKGGAQRSPLTPPERTDRMREIRKAEIEELFDVKHNVNELGTLSYMAEPIEGYVGSLKYRTHKVIAGDMLYIDTVPVYVKAKGRAKQTKVTKECQQRLNDARKLRQLEMLANTNFTDKDVHVTLTYKKAPRSEAEANTNVRNFIRRVQRAREAKGLPPAKYLGRVEGGDEEYKRRHAHLLMSGGLTPKELEAIWDKGFVNADNLQPDDEGLRGIVRYIFKTYAGARDRYGRARCRYIRSRNLVPPKERVTNCPISNRRIRTIASDMGYKAREVLEAAFPGYKVVGDVQVRSSTYCDGVLVRAELIRIR